MIRSYQIILLLLIAVCFGAEGAEALQGSESAAQSAEAEMMHHAEIMKELILPYFHVQRKKPFLAQPEKDSLAKLASTGTKMQAIQSSTSEKSNAARGADERLATFDVEPHTATDSQVEPHAAGDSESATVSRTDLELGRLKAKVASETKKKNEAKAKLHAILAQTPVPTVLPITTPPRNQECTRVIDGLSRCGAEAVARLKQMTKVVHRALPLVCSNSCIARAAQKRSDVNMYPCHWLPQRWRFLITGLDLCSHWLRQQGARDGLNGWELTAAEAHARVKASIQSAAMHRAPSLAVPNMHALKQPKLVSLALQDVRTDKLAYSPVAPSSKTSSTSSTSSKISSASSENTVKSRKHTAKPSLSPSFAPITVKPGDSIVRISLAASISDLTPLRIAQVRSEIALAAQINEKEVFVSISAGSVVISTVLPDRAASILTAKIHTKQMPTLGGLKIGGVVHSTNAPAMRPFKWGYGQNNGPSTWPVRFGRKTHGGQCDGLRQSPIDITTSSMAKPSRTIAKLDLVYNRRGTYQMINTGHGIRMHGGNPERSPFVFFNGTKFFLDHIVFHRSSEHRIAHIQYPFEAQLYHRSAKQELLAIAVLFKVGVQNVMLDQRLHWTKMPKKHGGKSIIGSFAPVDLLPKSLEYYYYTGSLTTPPCTEGVRWLVLKKSLSLSAAQLSQFAYTHNSRPVQPLHGRQVQYMLQSDNVFKARTDYTLPPAKKRLSSSAPTHVYITIAASVSQMSSAELQLIREQLGSVLAIPHRALTVTLLSGSVVLRVSFSTTHLQAAAQATSTLLARISSSSLTKVGSGFWILRASASRPKHSSRPAVCTGKFKYCRFLATNLGFCHPVAKPCPSVDEPASRHNSIVFRSLWGRYLYPAEAHYALYAKKHMVAAKRYASYQHGGQGTGAHGARMGEIFG
jgi:carbonic anhydrase